MWKAAPEQPFADRLQAGRALAQRLQGHAHRPATVVLALPRGGVPVGFEVARLLHVPLDVMLVRKLGVPGQEELAMGAIASGGHRVFNSRVVELYCPDPEEMEVTIAREEQELERRERSYRNGRPRHPVRGRSVILVDDGLATGATMCVAARAVRAEGPAHLVIAVPVAAASTVESLRDEADEIVVCTTPESFMSVGEWYLDFSPTEDAEVIELLRRAQRWPSDKEPRPGRGSV